MIDTAKYLDREFHWRNYNCWDFIREVWRDHCGVDLGRRTPDDITVKALVAAFSTQEFDVDGSIVTRIAEPEDPCLVMMVRPKILSHVGIFVNNQILHLIPRGKAQLQDFRYATIGFPEVRFYK